MISPTSPITPSSGWSATHRPDRSSRVRYSSKAAPGSSRGLRCAVQLPVLLGQLDPQARGRDVVRTAGTSGSPLSRHAVILYSPRRRRRYPTWIDLLPMDLAYLRAHPQHLPTFLTHQRIRETPVPGGEHLHGVPADPRRRRVDLRQDLAGAGDRRCRRASSPPRPPGCDWLREPGGGARARGDRRAAATCSRWSGSSPASPRRAAAERPRPRRWPRCTGPARTAFGAPWPGSSARCRRTTPRRRARGRRGSPSAGSCRTCGCSTDSGALTGDRRRPGRAGDHQHRAVRRQRAACPHPRRPVAGQRAVGRRRPGLAGRPGRARRAPGDRPGPARAVRRRAAPGPAARRVPGGVAAGGRLAATGSAAPAAPAARAHGAVRAALPVCGRRVAPMPRCGPDALPSSDDHAPDRRRRPRRTGSAGWPPTCGSR